MAIPNVSVTVQDGGLGLIGPSTNGIQVKVGTTSLGTNNAVYVFSDLETLRSTIGYGPAAEAAAHVLSTAGGIVKVCKVETTTAGSVGTVTLTGTSPDPGAGFTGGAKDTYSIIVQILTGGTRGTATFRISFDGGDTYSPEIATAASITTFVAETGLTVTFQTGTYVAGDSYAATASPPVYTVSALNTALDALNASTESFEFLHIVGIPADMSAYDTLAAAVSSKLSTFANSFRFTFAILELPDVSAATVAADATFQAFSDKRIGPVFGFYETISPLTSKQERRPFAWAYAARLSSIGLQRDPGAVADGPLPNVISITFDQRTGTTNLHDLGVTTGRTFANAVSTGVPGFYVTGGRQKVGVTSDFRSVTTIRVINRACAIAYEALIQYLNADVRTTPPSLADDQHPEGSILEEDARSIEADIDKKLAAGLIAPDFAMAAKIIVNRLWDLATTETMKTNLRVRLKSYARFIDLIVAASRDILWLLTH